MGAEADAREAAARPLFEALQLSYLKSPPKPFTKEDAKIAVVDLPSGLQALDPKLLPSILENVYHALSDDGAWRFTLMAEENKGGGVTDVLLVSHADCRTLADWELIVRFRSWVLTDERSAVILLPATAPDALETFRNDRPNAIQILSIRE